MGLSNAAKRARTYNSIINQNQGGGNKKAGFPNMVGRDSWTTIYYQGDRVGKGTCCNRNQLMQLSFTNRNVHLSRPIGGDVRTTYYRNV